jgi:hypothetical protein
LAPLRFQQTAFGITLDNAPWRMQRILYPALAWGASFGRAAWLPAAMFLVNLLGLAAVAMFAVLLTARLRLPALTPLAIMVWPGFIIALTRDTTEIVAAAFLLGALDSYFAKRLLAFGVLGALATLTRETSILVLGGILCFELLRAIRDATAASCWRRVAICGLALVPFLVWREMLRLFWGDSFQDAALAANMGWPFAGAATMLRDSLTGIRRYAPAPGFDAEIRTYTIASTCWLLSFCAVVAARLPAALRMAGAGALAAGWLPVIGLMSTLTANGPWIESTAYFRAFTECYLVGSLIPAARPTPGWRSWVLVAGGVAVWLVAWFLANS